MAGEVDPAVSRGCTKRRSAAALPGIATASIAVAVLAGACVGPRSLRDEPGSAEVAADRRARLEAATSWCIQLQGFDDAESRRQLVQAPVDIVVFEPAHTVRGQEDHPIPGLVARVQRRLGPAGLRRLCIAYLNVGQAEDYRTYWQPTWRPPTVDAGGDPSFLITVDPEGWVGNYPVAFWDAGWQAQLWGRPDALLDRIIDAGFDGVYMDWILGYGEPTVVAAAERAGVDAAAEMERLLQHLGEYARARAPGFLLIAQNATDLVLERRGVLAAVDAVAQEDLSFRGSATAKWGDAAAGGDPAPAAGPWSSAELGARLAEVRSLGLPVLTLDYALKPDEIASALQRSRDRGLLPFVSQTPLDRLPPWGPLRAGVK